MAQDNGGSPPPSEEQPSEQLQASQAASQGHQGPGGAQVKSTGGGNASNPSEQQAMRPQHTVGADYPLGIYYSREAIGDPNWQPDPEQLTRDADERERERARSRGLTEEELDKLSQNTIWVVSNRVDDRVVIFERDPRHPGGEAFVGGSAPARVYKTPNVQRLLLGMEVVEVPEPMRTVTVRDPQNDKEMTVRNRKLPQDLLPDPGLTVGAQPGHATPIGRKLDKDLWDESAINKVRERQAQAPAAIPVAPGGIVPRQEDVDRPA